MLCIGDVHQITWVTQDFVDNIGNDLGYHIKIELTRDNDQSRETIAASMLAATGTFNWIVTGPETSQARVILTCLEEPALFDGSDDIFTISAFDATYSTPAYRIVSASGSASKLDAQVKYQDPDERKDYQINWSAAIAGDSIVTSTWIAGAGIAITSAGFSSTLTRVWVSGGTAGQAYTLTNRITTTIGRVFDLSFSVYIQQN